MRRVGQGPHPVLLSPLALLRKDRRRRRKPCPSDHGPERLPQAVPEADLTDEAHAHRAERVHRAVADTRERIWAALVGA